MSAYLRPAVGLGVLLPAGGERVGHHALDRLAAKLKRTQYFPGVVVARGIHAVHNAYVAFDFERKLIETDSLPDSAELYLFEADDDGQRDEEVGRDEAVQTVDKVRVLLVAEEAQRREHRRHHHHERRLGGD